jgi:hypothetical protein
VLRQGRNEVNKMNKEKLKELENKIDSLLSNIKEIRNYIENDLDESINDLKEV